jgi:alcohol dehydrogenase class IV
MRLRLPATILSEPGVLAEVGEHTRAAGVRRALLVTDPVVAGTGTPERVAGFLAEAGVEVGWFTGVVPEPSRCHVEACRDAFRSGGHDALVAVGGGSVLDVAKGTAALGSAPALDALYGPGRVTATGLPAVIAVPTTPGTGSEVSSHAAILEPAAGRKYVVSGPALIPRAVVADPDVLATLPTEVLVGCAADALLHGIEAYLGRAATPSSDALALDGVGRVAAALAAVATDGRTPARIGDLMVGGLHTGLAMAHAGAGVVHALGYPLSIRFGLPHGLSNALVAPAALAAAEQIAGERAARLARACGGRPGGSLSAAVADLFGGAGIVAGLRRCGVREQQLAELAAEALEYEPVRRNSPLPGAEPDLVAAYRACL